MIEIKYIQCLGKENFSHYQSLFHSFLSESEIADSEKIKNDKQRTEHLLGIVVSRFFLSQYLSVSPRMLQWEYGVHGKPFCKNYPDIFFNISHGGCYVAVAFSDHPIGIDVESWKRKVPNHLAQRFFSETEQNQLNNAFGDEQQRLFFQFWTAKESYLKMLGTGLTQPLSSFSIQWDQGFPEILDADHQKVDCCLYQFMPDDDHIISVCARNKIDNISYQRITMDDFGNN